SAALIVERSPRQGGMPSPRLGIALALLIGAALYGGYGVYKHGTLPKSAVLDLALHQLDTYRRSVDSTSELRRHLEEAPVPATAMGRLGKQHTLLTFVESYGVSAILDAPYRQVLAPRLEAVQADLEARGIHMATGRLRS